MFASTAPNPETVSTLLAHGAEVGISDSNEHWTALMFAAAEGCDKVAEILIERGADPKAKDIDGDTAIDFARQNGHEELAKMIESKTAQ